MHVLTAAQLWYRRERDESLGRYPHATNGTNHGLRSEDSMRKKTLISVCFILSLALIYLIRWLAASTGIRLPFVGIVSSITASLIAVPLLLIPMTALNAYLLKWRKAHGRDIEAEERHEFDDADIISLRPRQPHEHTSTYRRWGGDDN
jgi:hypothetical protein